MSRNLHINVSLHTKKLSTIAKYKIRVHITLTAFIFLGSTLSLSYIFNTSNDANIDNKMTKNSNTLTNSGTITTGISNIAKIIAVIILLFKIKPPQIIPVMLYLQNYTFNIIT